MPTRSADDFDAIRKHLEIIREREGEQPLESPKPTSKSTPNATVSEDREPTPSADYGLCYTQYYKQHNVNVKD